jgi:tetratricopeptide (TPR) repeat protein
MQYGLLLLCLGFFALPVFAQSTNRAQDVSSASVPAVANTNDPVELAYEKLMQDDDAAMAEVDAWIQENQRFADQGAGVPSVEMNARIRKRIEPVRRAYEDFLQKHPNHGRARLAFASFLEATGDEDEALVQMLKAKEVEPNNPAVWNNLANHYGHRSPVTNAFTHYEKAIELDPKEPVYYHNFGTTVYLFRKDAMAHYGITEQQVFDKALTLYSNALALDGTNFVLATDVAMSYYGIKPPRPDAAIAAWDRAMSLAGGPLEREGVFVHLARWKVNAGRFAEAQADLNVVTNAALQEVKLRVQRNLNERKNPPASATNNAVVETPAATTSVLEPLPAKP